MPKVTPLKIAIIASGMTVRDVAARIGRHESSVSRWANDTRHPDVVAKRALAEVLGMTVAELWPRDGARAAG